jgi:hypothetical protein
MREKKALILLRGEGRFPPCEVPIRMEQFRPWVGLPGSWVMLELIVGLLVGFLCGYLAREAISQRRRAAIRRHFLEQQAQRVARQQMHIESLKLSAKRALKSHRRSAQ